MPTVEIGGTTYEVYDEQANVQLFLEGQLGQTAWLNLDPNTTQRQAMVSATKLMDRTPWLGSKTAPAQPIDWPRTGITDCEGQPVDPADTPQDILDGFAELCDELAGDPDTVQDNASTGSNNKKLKAGSVEIEYFRSTLNQGSRFPQRVQEYFRCYLQGAGSSAAGLASGTDGVSAYGPDSFGLRDGFA